MRVNNTRLLQLLALYTLTGCNVVDPTGDAGVDSGSASGLPFGQNVCFQCTLQKCSISANACALDAPCAAWSSCVSACPTAADGVSADGTCLVRCGLPLSADVFAQCIQDYSTGFLLGCESACTPRVAADS